MHAAESIEIDDGATIVSSSVADSLGYALWSSLTLPVVAQTFCRWKAYSWVSQTTTSAEPGTDEDWERLSLVNRYAMFDDSLATSTIDDSDITVVLEPQEKADLVAVINVTAESITITHTRGASTIYTDTVTLNGARNAAWLLDWEDGDQYELEFTVLDDLVAEVGKLAIGSAKYLGDVLYPFGITLRDFSSQERDVFGIVQLIERGSVNILEFQLRPNPQSEWNNAYLWISGRSGPIIWVGVFEEPATITYGLRRRLIGTVNGHNDRVIELDVESFDPT